MSNITKEAQSWSAWHKAAGRAEIDQAIRAIYADLDAAIAAKSPTCWLSGKCCHFESYGHRLYVTALEIAWLIQQLDTPQITMNHDELVQIDGCPFQQNKLCGVHTVRPLGCRIYYCDPNAQGWQNEIYEIYLNRLRALHEQHGLDYRYLEWRAGLAEANAMLEL